MSDEEDSRSGAAVDRIVGNLTNSVVGSLLQSWGIDPNTANALGGTVGPLSEEASYAFRRLTAKRSEGIRRMLQRSADSQGVSISDLLEAAVSDATKLELLGRAMEAAAKSTSDAKIDTLARAFATGVLAADRAVVDEELLVVDTLAQLDAPHLRLLAVLTGEAPHTRLEGEPAQQLEYSWTVEEILTQDPGLSTAIDALIAKLRGLGVIQDDGQGRLDYKPYWGLTPFGRACISALNSRGIKAIEGTDDSQET